VYTPATDDVARQRYYPFGDLRGTDGTVTTDIGYTGQRRDDATGLMYYQARYYDPLTARFTQPDSIVPDLGNPQDLNRYSYVRNNPATYTDPSGNALIAGNTWQNAGSVKKTKNGTRYYGTPKKTYRPGANDRAVKHRSPSNVKKLYSPPKRKSRGVVGRARDLGRGARDSAVGSVRGVVNAVKNPVETLKGLAACAANLAGCGAMMVAQFADTCRAEGIAYCAGTLAPDVLAMLASGGAGIALRSGRLMNGTGRAAGVMRRATRYACSFAAATGVVMADGSRKPIAEVEVGDRVLAADPQTGERGARTVTHVWKHADTLVELETADGATVTTTEDHPFWNATDQQWQPAYASILATSSSPRPARSSPSMVST
jgi:RHS repeat-associated protein